MSEDNGNIKIVLRKVPDEKARGFGRDDAICLALLFKNALISFSDVRISMRLEDLIKSAAIEEKKEIVLQKDEAGLLSKMILVVESNAQNKVSPIFGEALLNIGEQLGLKFK